MKRSLLQLFVISSIVLISAAGAHGSSRPRYGGNVRVLLHDRVMSIDPLSDEDRPAARDRMAALLFETLTELDAQGRLQPGLASSWHAENSKRVWQFRLRLANFHDGTVLTAADAAASLARSNPAWKFSAPDRQTVSIETPYPVQQMSEILALPRYAIVKRQTDSTGAAILIGTGSYKLTQWQAGEHAQFSANEDYWGGRPFVDSIEFQMGSSLRDQLMDRQLGTYAATELSIDQLRTVEQNNQTVALSRPSDLLALVFLQSDSGGRPGKKPVDLRVREALNLAINRAAISNVLFQRRGIPASGLLPQWLTGYEFMFGETTSLEHARELRADAAAFVVISPISLAYDFSDPLAKLVAERIAVDAREAGIIVQPYAESHINSKAARSSINADAVLLRTPLESLDPSAALSARMDDLALFAENTPAILGATRAEDLAEIEHKMLGGFRVLPIAHIPQALWLNNNAHNWQQMANGTWQLDQLWIEGAR
ncbi:MAG TPA: ABC transporter substrate-binding protein [Candidatus Angelobacter sp.]|jgi:ABC-type transport system substrate-binding protein|nr:ABC transporter substrate-binding protein [Candidatus Angelobacter sp.]